MRLFDRHGRFQRELSSYLDGELDARAAERLERHLAACPACRDELAELRATADALRGLPEPDVPRSFTISREKMAASAPGRAPAPAFAFGARIAAAALAVALTAVVIVDLGDFGGETSPQGMTAADRSADGEAAPGAVEEPAEGAETPAAGEDTAGGAADTDDATSQGGEPSPEADGSMPPNAFGGDATGGGEADDVSEPEPAAGARGDGGGIGALTAAEIALAAAVGVSLTGSLVLAYAGRKR